MSNINGKTKNFIGVFLFFALVLGLFTPSFNAQAAGTILVDNLQPSWDALGGGGVYSAYYGPSNGYIAVSPGTTTLFDGREAGIIKAGLTIDPDDGIFEDEGLFGFKPNVTIDVFAAGPLSYDVQNEAGVNPVWITIEIDINVIGDRTDNIVYQYVPAPYSSGWNTVDAAAGLWQAWTNTIDGITTGPLMTLAEVATAHTGSTVIRAYLRLGMGDSYNNSGTGTIAWVDKVVLGDVTYDFVTAKYWYVTTTGSDSNTGTQVSPFLTIQKAINSAAAGDTVYIAAGDYIEGGITVDKALTLQGDGPANTHIIGASTPVFHITANDVNMYALEITHATQLTEGIRVSSTNGLTLDLIKFSNLANGTGNAYGVQFMNSFMKFAVWSNTFTGIDVGTYERVSAIYMPNPYTASDFTIEGSTFENVFTGVDLRGHVDGLEIWASTFGPMDIDDCRAAASGIYMGDGPVDISIQDVFIHNNTFTSYCRGIYMWEYRDGTIGQFTIQENTFTNSIYSSAVRLITDYDTNPALSVNLEGPIDIVDNTFTQANAIVGGAGVSMVDIRVTEATPSSQININNNDITFTGPFSVSTFGMMFRGPITHFNISDCAFNGGGAGGASAGMPPTSAIYIKTNDSAYGSIDPSAVMNINDNSFTGFTNAVSVYDGVAAVFGGLPAGAELNINWNSIAGNTNGVVSGPGEITQASANWWGAASGPGPVGPGTGDTVSLYVQYGPYWMNAGMDQRSPVKNITQDLWYSTIQPAVDAANPGDVIEVSGGTLNVDTPITVDVGVTIASVPGETARIVGTGTNMFKVFVITSSDVVIKDLEITLAVTPAYPLLVGDELNSSLISIPSGTGMTGIVIQDNILYVPVQAPPMTGWTARAITVGGSTVSGMTITGNTIYNTRNGIVIHYNNSVNISANTIYNTKGGIMNYTGSQADADNRVMTDNTWTAVHNEWDIVWNSGGGPYAQDYNKDVLLLSGANNNAYVLSLMVMPPETTTTMTGNRSHVWVNITTGTTTLKGANGNMNLPYAKIQDGINAVVPGGTVYVAAGTYYQQVSLNKSLTLQGAGAATTIIDGTGLSVTPLVSITTGAGNVLFEGFTLQNGGIVGGHRMQMTVSGGNPGDVVDIANNIIICSGVDTDDDYGMYASGGLSDLIFRGNSVSNCAYHGIFFERYKGATNIHDNTFTSLDVAGPVIGFMTYENPTDPAGSQDITAKQWVHDNQIDANGGSGILFMAPFGWSYNQYKGGSFTNIVIDANTITNVGDYGKGIQLEVDGDVGGIFDAVIMNNVLSAQNPGVGTSRGIRLLGGVIDTSITGNTISGFYRGVYQSYSFGVAGTGPSGTVLRFNLIDGNILFGVENQYTLLANNIDAASNWWGAASGPGTVGPGTGDKVSANVDYTPWCTVADCSKVTADLISPEGTLITWDNDFYWTGNGGALSYQLDVRRQDGSWIKTAWFSSTQTHCAAGTDCYLLESELPLAMRNLAAGDYQWRVMIRYADTMYSPWSEYKLFTVPAVIPPTCYTLTLTVAGGTGVITPDLAPNCGTQYTAGTVVTLTAAPDAGFGFVSWSGSASGSISPVVVTMNADKAVTMNLKPIPVLGEPNDPLTSWDNGFYWTGVSGAINYQLDVRRQDGSWIKTAWFSSTQTHCAAGTACYLLESELPLFMQNMPVGAYQWRLLVRYANTTYGPWTAYQLFTVTTPCYTLALTVVGGTGAITPDLVPDCGAQYTAGTVVTLTANPDVGFGFVSWSGNASGSISPVAVTMNADKAVTMNLKPIPVLGTPLGNVGGLWDNSFHWTGVSGAINYQLDVRRQDGSWIKTAWFSSTQTHCAAGTACYLLESELPLFMQNMPVGAYQWRLLVRYANTTYGPWTAYQAFLIP